MTPRDRRALAIGGAVALAAIALLRVLPLAAEHIGFARERAAHRVASLAQARRLLREAPVMRESLRVAVAELVAAAPALIEGRSHADAAATLVAWIALSAERCDLRVAQSESTADADTGAIRPVTVRTQLEGDIVSIACLLRAVEGGTPLLTVRTLALTALDATPRAGAPEVLRLDATLSGWYLAPVTP